MNLVIDDDGVLYDVVKDIEKISLIPGDDQYDYDIPYTVAEQIDAAIAYVAKDALKSVGKMFKVGDRVVAYDHMGKKHGKGTVIKSRDKRLLNYIHVQFDDSEFHAYYRADLCRRLVPKKARVG